MAARLWQALRRNPLASRRAPVGPDLLFALVLLLVAGCGDSAPVADSGAEPAPFEAGFSRDGGEVLHTGDLSEIRDDGRLRILTLRTTEAYLPRSGSPLDRERKLAAALARDLGLEPEFVTVDGLDELIPALLAGRGDLVADNFTVTEERRHRVAFSAPVATVSEQVVVRATDSEIRDAAGLTGRRIAVRRSSSFWESVVQLQKKYPGIEIEDAPERMETDELLDSVAQGRLDVTLADSNLVRAALDFRDDLRVAFDLGEPRIIAWAMRPDSGQLRRAVDSYLARVDPHSSDRHLYTDDLPGIAKRGRLRVLTRNSATTYFIWRGQLLGFEYELAKEFAARWNLELEMVVPPSRGDLIPWLRAGKGDIIAAALTATPERIAQEEVAFSRNYIGADEVVVSRAEDVGINGLSDLRGRTLVVRRSSSYWTRLDALQSDYGFELMAAPEELETEQIIARVATGHYDLTVADSHIVGVELAWRDDVRHAFELGERVAHGWAVRTGNPELRTAIDAFFTQEFRGLFYNVLVRKYFRDPAKVRRHVESRSAPGRISKWDPLIRKYARLYGFDWRLIAAQMHQESRFDPKARSFAGARGLLQMLPRTGREFGFDSLEEPEKQIEAGVQYLHWLRKRFPSDIPERSRTWLSLASYNAGYGHVRDAQRIARERGWDEHRWFGNVEKAMLLKERPEVYQKTRFGYARGREPVQYVRTIRDLYDAYLQVAGPLASADPGS